MDDGSHLILSDRSECLGRISGTSSREAHTAWTQAKKVPAFENIQTGSEEKIVIFSNPSLANLLDSH